MTTTRVLKYTWHEGDLWRVFVREVHRDAPPGADLRERMEKTRTYDGSALFIGTADQCRDYIEKHRKEIETYERI